MEKFCHRGGRRGIDTFLKPDRIHVKVGFPTFQIKAIDRSKRTTLNLDLLTSEQIRRLRGSVGGKLQHSCCGKVRRGEISGTLGFWDLWDSGISGNGNFSYYMWRSVSLMHVFLSGFGVRAQQLQSAGSIWGTWECECQLKSISTRTTLNFSGFDILHARRVAGLEQSFLGKHRHRSAPRHRPGGQVAPWLIDVLKS